MTLYPAGQPVQIYNGTLTTGTPATPVDPAAMSLSVRRPDGNTDTYTIGALIRDSVGAYHYDYLPAAAGRYAYRFVSTTPTAAIDGYFDVAAAFGGTDAGQTFVPSGYLTVAEFKAMPTGVSVNDLIGSGSATVNDTELANVLLRASAWADNYCQVALGAQTFLSEHQRTTVRPDGLARISPRQVSGNIPIVSVTRIAYGTPGALTTVTAPSVTWVEDGAFVVLLTGSPGMTSWSGSLPPLGLTGSTGGLGTTISVEYDYIAGFPNSTLTSAATVGATTVTVVNATGVVAGTRLRICDPGSEESVTVASVAGNTLTLTGPLLWPHAVAVGISAIPQDVKAAVADIACAFLTRATIPETSATLTNFSGSSVGAGINPPASGSPNYFANAASTLDSYRRFGAL